MVVIVVLDLLLIRGIKETAGVAKYLVWVKLAVVAVFIGSGALYIATHWHVAQSNYHNFMPFGWDGVAKSTTSAAFAYIGFDSLTTAAEECKDPVRDLRYGILGSLVISAICYVLVVLVLSGVQNYAVVDRDAPIAVALSSIAPPLLTTLVGVGAIAGLSIAIRARTVGLRRAG